MTDDLIAIVELLDNERDALRQGRIGDLARLGVLKERMIAQIESARIASGEIEQIGRLLRRNQRLLAAAIAGFADGRSRVAQILGTARGFDAYARDGRTARISSAITPEFERRA